MIKELNKLDGDEFLDKFLSLDNEELEQVLRGSKFQDGFYLLKSVQRAVSNTRCSCKEKLPWYKQIMNMSIDRFTIFLTSLVTLCKQLLDLYEKRKNRKR